MSVFSLINLFKNGTDFKLLKSSLINISIFCFAILLTAVVPLWEGSNLNFGLTCIGKIFLALPIFLLFRIHFLSSIKANSVWIVFISLSLFIIIQNTGFKIKENLNFIGLDISYGPWNEKYHAFWLVLFFWVIIYFVKNSNSFKKYTTVLFVTVAVYTSYSESAKLALFTSFLIYMIFKKNPIKAWNYIYCILIAYISVFPFLFQIIPLSGMDWLYDRVYVRLLLFEVASNAIFENFLIGKGFGSSINLNIIPFLPDHDSSAKEWLRSYQTFPGNHPHNFVALIWLEFGLLGATMLLLFLYKFNKFINQHKDYEHTVIFLICLFVTAVILFSLSWSIWQTDVVMTYIMFSSCLIFISSGAKTLHKFEN